MLTLARASDGFGASWGKDGTIVFSPSQNSGLFRVSQDGGEPEQLTKPDFGDAGYAHVWPQHLPGGESVLFTIAESVKERTVVLELGTRDWHVVGTFGGASYSVSGHLLFYERQLGTGLFAAPFDPELRSVTGPPAQVLPDVTVYTSQSGRPYFAISSDGTAIYVARGSELSTLAWMDRAGAMTPILNQDGSVAMPRLSPDGERVAFHDEQGNSKVLHLDRGSVDILWSEAGPDAASAVWHPNGDKLALVSNRTGSWDIHEVLLSARSEPVPLLSRDYDQEATSWSSDGTHLAYFESHPSAGLDLWVLPIGEEPVPILATPANEYQGMFSPDGRYLAYVSDESGRPEVYVRAVRDGETHLVSAGGGNAPMWSKDGRELFYRNGREFHAVAVTTENGFRASAPGLLHDVPFDRGYPLWPVYYDVAADGRFLVVEDRSTTQFNVIFNWFEELKELAPTQE